MLLCSELNRKSVIGVVNFITEDFGSMGIPKVVPVKVEVGSHKARQCC